MFERLTLVAAIAGAMLGVSGLTTLGAVIGAIGGLAGLCAFVQMLRIRSTLNDIEQLVQSAIGKTTEEATPPPETAR